MLGTLSLDLDGTLTHGANPPEVRILDWLKLIEKQGWGILFNTGRGYSFALKTLGEIDFPHTIAVQNGACLIDGPSKNLLAEALVPKDFVEVIEELEAECALAFAIEGGFALQDSVYFCPNALTAKDRSYFISRKRLQGNPWIELKQWEEFPREQGMPIVKAFGSFERLKLAKHMLLDHPQVDAMQIQDPYREGEGILLITKKGVDKAYAIENYFALGLGKRPLISAGDDVCDLPMLKCADIKLVSEKSPLDLRHLGDILFTIQSSEGILQALKDAVKRIQS